MKRGLSWIILVLSHSCSLICTGIHAKSNEFDIKQAVSSKDNKPSDITDSVGKLPGRTLSKSLDFRKSRNQGPKIPPLGNTTVGKQNSSETRITTEVPSSDKVNLSSTDTTQNSKSKGKIIFIEHKANIVSNQATAEHKDNYKQNNASHLRVRKPKIEKGSKHVHRRINEEVIEKRAKKLLVSFFDSELDDTENAKRSHVNTTRKTDTTNNVRTNNVRTNNVRTNEQKIKNLNTTKNATLGSLYKRTELLYNAGASQAPRVLVPSLKQNDQVVETILPSGPGAERPQHIRVSNQPTHVMFKPVHKYYPTIHRYMTRPIHRFLNKPVNFGGLTPQLLPPRHAGGLLQPGPAQAIPVRPMPPNVLPGARLVTASHPVQDNAGQMGPVRMFAPMTAGIPQPVLIHPHRLSPAGNLSLLTRITTGKLNHLCPCDAALVCSMPVPNKREQKI